MTQEQVVKNRLEEVGYVDVFWAIENYILRLASIIFYLKKDGYVFDGDFGDGKDKKNYHYKLKSSPKRDYSINGISPFKENTPAPFPVKKEQNKLL